MITIDEVRDLQTWAGIWADRDPNAFSPVVRQAAETAIVVIDSLLAQLYLLRGKTIEETRIFDDLVKARRGPQVPADVMARIDTAPWPDRSGWDQQ